MAAYRAAVGHPTRPGRRALIARGALAGLRTRGQGLLGRLLAVASRADQAQCCS